MGNYQDIEHQLRGKTNLKVLLLDTNNLQFYYQHQQALPQIDLFQPYDVVCVPGWVQTEFAHHDGKSEYVANIPTPLFFIDEINDYLPMVQYQDKRLMELFRSASPYGEAQKFFMKYRSLPADELPDDWIELFYEHGFTTRQTGTITTKKNAGEVSILTLAFLLLSHYGNEISNISIATSDFGIIALKNKVMKAANTEPINLGISSISPISYLSTDVSLFHFVKQGIILPEHLIHLRSNPKSSIYIEYFGDGSSTIHEVVVDTPSFIEICNNPDKYRIIF